MSSQSERRWTVAALLCLTTILLLWIGIATDANRALRQRVKALERHNMPQQTAGDLDIKAIE